jgi:hypothetical protein
MYNADLYNDNEYNLTAYVEQLTESIASSDSLSKLFGLVRTDSQNTSDLLSDQASLAAFHDTVSIFQRARTPFMYNGGLYNWYMYNLRLDEDEILLMAMPVLYDAVGSTDTLMPFSVYQVLLESMAYSDLLTTTSMPVLMEFLFSSDYNHVQMSNKALNATLRLNDWLEIAKPSADQWSSV